MGIDIRTDRKMRAFTGVSLAEFERRLECFTAVAEARRQQRYEAAVQAGQRQRQLELMPAREFATVDELMTALDGIAQIVIDATERLYHRPQGQVPNKNTTAEKNSIP